MTAGNPALSALASGAALAQYFPAMMTSITARVNDERGVHARPSALIVKACREYPGTVTVSRADAPDSPEVDGKDMMGLVEMDATYKTLLRFCVEWPENVNRADLEKEEQRAQALCNRLAEIVAMTLDEIERFSP